MEIPKSIEQEFPILVEKRLSPELKAIFAKKIMYFKAIAEENRSLGVPNARAALDLLRMRDYYDKVGIYNFILFQQGRRVRPKDLVSTKEKGPIDNVVSSAGIYR